MTTNTHTYAKITVLTQTTTHRCLSSEVDIGEFDIALRKHRRAKDHRSATRNSSLAGSSDPANMDKPLPSDLDACLTLPSGLDQVGAVITNHQTYIPLGLFLTYHARIIK